MLPLVDSQRTSAAVAAAVLCVFVLVCLLIIRNGKTKLKSRYGHMILTIVVAFVILIRMYPLDSGGEIVPAAVAVRRASDEVFKIQGESLCSLYEDSRKDLLFGVCSLNADQLSHFQLFPAMFSLGF